jgi:hypothetical protein
MFAELDRYKKKDHFFFTLNDKLKDVCNAPADKGGVFVIYALKNGRIELVYVGCAGRKIWDGSLFLQKGGLRGMIMNRHQFGKTAKVSWPVQMLAEGIEALDIYWYVTYEGRIKHNPEEIEENIMQQIFDIGGQLPRWNML